MPLRWFLLLLLAAATTAPNPPNRTEVVRMPQRIVQTTIPIGGLPLLPPTSNSDEFWWLCRDAFQTGASAKQFCYGTRGQEINLSGANDTSSEGNGSAFTLTFLPLVDERGAKKMADRFVYREWYTSLTIPNCCSADANFVTRFYYSVSFISVFQRRLVRDPAQPDDGYVALKVYAYSDNDVKAVDMRARCINTRANSYSNFAYSDWQSSGGNGSFQATSENGLSLASLIADGRSFCSTVDGTWVTVLQSILSQCLYGQAGVDGGDDLNAFGPTAWIPPIWVTLFDASDSTQFLSAIVAALPTVTTTVSKCNDAPTAILATVYQTINGSAINWSGQKAALKRLTRATMSGGNDFWIWMIIRDAISNTTVARVQVCYRELYWYTIENEWFFMENVENATAGTTIDNFNSTVGSTDAHLNYAVATTTTAGQRTTGSLLWANAWSAAHTMSSVTNSSNGDGVAVSSQFDEWMYAYRINIILAIAVALLIVLVVFCVLWTILGFRFVRNYGAYGRLGAPLSRVSSLYTATKPLGSVDAATLPPPPSFDNDGNAGGGALNAALKKIHRTTQHYNSSSALLRHERPRFSDTAFGGGKLKKTTAEQPTIVVDSGRVFTTQTAAPNPIFNTNVYDTDTAEAKATTEAKRRRRRRLSRASITSITPPSPPPPPPILPQSTFPKQLH